MPKNKFVKLFQTTLNLLFILTLISCAQIKTRKDLKREGRQQEMAEGVETKGAEGKVFGTEPGAVDQIPQEAEVHKTKVGIILGPGGIKAFAHTGVIRELENARIPIDAIVGIEWGALVGGLYAQRAQIHEAEWTLYKMEKKDFYSKGFFEDTFQPKPINEFLDTIKPQFLNSNIQDYQVAYSCPSRSIWSGRVSFQNRGSSKQALSRCLAFPPFFKGEVPWMAAGFSLDEAKKYLTSKGINLVIYVNVLSHGDLFEKKWASKNMKTALLWRELQAYSQNNPGKMDYVISVETRKFNIFDFENRKYLVRAGEKAGRKAAKEILKNYGF